MSSDDGLLSFLAARLKVPAEPLATEALTWVLGHPAAVAGLTSRLHQLGPGLPSQLVFRHQGVADDLSRPDLVGDDADGHGRLVVEVKFDAGLMASQPVSYLRQAATARDHARAHCQVPDEVTAMVLFVVPEQRLESVWHELIRRTRQKWPDAAIDAGARMLIVEDGLRLVCLSWADTLTALSEGLQGRGGQFAAEGLVLSDTSVAVEGLRQLQGMVSYFERISYAPLTSTDLTDRRLPMLWMSLTDIIRTAVDRLVGDATVAADRKSLTQSGQPDNWGLYLRLEGLTVQICKHTPYWRLYEQSPLWMVVSNTDRTNVALAREALRGWDAQTPPRLIVTTDGQLAVPLVLPVDAEQDVAVAAVVAQLLDVRDALRAVGVPAEG